MNHFLELKVWGKDRVVRVRPDAVVAVERRDDDPYEYVYLTSGDTFMVGLGQFATNNLINRTSHAGMRVLG